jgi:hypothetical protein
MRPYICLLTTGEGLHLNQSSVDRNGGGCFSDGDVEDGPFDNGSEIRRLNSRMWLAAPFYLKIESADLLTDLGLAR